MSKTISGLSTVSPKGNFYDAIRQLSFWSSAIEIEPLEGGLTNSNFLVTQKREKFVVRLADDIPELNIARWHEVSASRSASAAGIAPEVVYHNTGVLIIRFIEGLTLRSEDVKDNQTLEKIINLLRECHQKVLGKWHGPMLAFWPFQVARGNGAWMLSRNSKFARLWPDLEDRINSLEKLAGPVSPTFSHNDLLAANFIDDGDRLWLIDWEYAGLNCAMFDLAGLAANNDLGDEVEDYLMEFYFGEPATSEMKQQYLALYTMCSLCEVTWALVQKEISKLNSDYDGYMRVNRQRLDSSLVRCGLAPLGEL